jgi:uncharacterized protein
MKRDQIISSLALIKPELEANGVAHLDVFGSRARGDASDDSDLDILIEVVPTSKFSILDLIGVEHRVQAATGIPANAFMRRSLDDKFLHSIARDVIKVF